MRWFDPKRARQGRKYEGWSAFATKNHLEDLRFVTCIYCGDPIPHLQIQSPLPNAATVKCVHCSTVFMVTEWDITSGTVTYDEETDRWRIQDSVPSEGNA